MQWSSRLENAMSYMWQETAVRVDNSIEEKRRRAGHAWLAGAEMRLWMIFDGYNEVRIKTLKMS